MPRKEWLFIHALHSNPIKYIEFINEEDYRTCPSMVPVKVFKKALELLNSFGLMKSTKAGIGF